MELTPNEQAAREALLKEKANTLYHTYVHDLTGPEHRQRRGPRPGEAADGELARSAGNDRAGSKQGDGTGRNTIFSSKPINRKWQIKQQKP